MARIVFTQQLRRFNRNAASRRAGRHAAWRTRGGVRGQPAAARLRARRPGHLRANVVAFVDGRRCRDRVHLDEALRPDSEVHVMQALSGG